MGHGKEAHQHKGDSIFGMGPGSGMVTGSLNRNPALRARPVPTEEMRAAMLRLMNQLAKTGQYDKIATVWQRWKQDGRVAPGKSLPARWKAPK